jgi:hypothetical protein
MSSNLLNWANSQTIGGVSEIAVMAPIKKGRVLRENRTYEERLRFAIGSLAGRVKQGVPTELDKVPTIHFGRMIILRPEQYLVYSDVQGVEYEDGDGGRLIAPTLKIPKMIDDYSEIMPPAPNLPVAEGLVGGGGIAKKPEFRSWLLTLVEFGGLTSGISPNSSPLTSTACFAIARISRRPRISKLFGRGSGAIRSPPISFIRAIATFLSCVSSSFRTSNVASMSSSPRCARRLDHA